MAPHASIVLLLAALLPLCAAGQTAGDGPSAEGQSPTYSYQSDRAFFHPADFRGVTLHPSEHVTGGETIFSAPGGISLAFGGIDLTISGVEGLDSTYYLADIQRSPEGFLAEIINPRHPSVPMRMTIGTDEDHFVHEVRLTTLEQGIHTFKLPERSAVDRAELDSLFTNRIEFHLEAYDTTTFFDFVPFLIEPDVAAESGVHVLDGETRFSFRPDSVLFAAPDGSEVGFFIDAVLQDQDGEDGAATTRYRMLLECSTGGPRKRDRQRAVIGIFFDAWHDAEYVVLGPARYYPRP